MGNNLHTPMSFEELESENEMNAKSSDATIANEELNSEPQSEVSEPVQETEPKTE